MKHIPTLAVAAAVTIMSLASAAARISAPTDDLGKRDIQVTLKPGQTYALPLPPTAYPGAPFTVTVVDPGVNISQQSGGWIMYITLAYANGSLSWAGLENQGGTTTTGWASPGQTQTMAGICQYNVGCAGVLQAVPVGSGEGVQLAVPANTPYGKQTFVIRMPDR